MQGAINGTNGDAEFASYIFNVWRLHRIRNQGTTSLDSSTRIDIS
jgi:hypothetical protein